MISPSLLVALAAALPLVKGHASIFHPSMWGISVTQTTMSYDNRPVVPLYNMDFQHWWFHNHLAYPPAADAIMEFPAGGSAEMEVSCDIGFTSYWSYGPGGDNRQNSDLTCPGQPTTAIHANNQQDVAGCAIAIAYKSDVNDVQPEDFIIFTVNYMCPWFIKNTFEVPADMPACPDGKCICAWFWIHKPDSGSEQMYMNGFQCNITGQTGDKALGKPGLPRRCGADPDNGKPDAVPSNCTVGPVNPMYWYQTERNNMFEDTYHAPQYNALYGFTDGAQQNLFQDATVGGAAATVPNAPSNPPPPPASSSSADTSTSAAASPSPVGAQSNPPPASPSPQQDQSQAPPAQPPAPPADSPTSAASSESAPASTPSRKCKRRPDSQKKKKRSAVQRHLKKRLAHDGISL